VKRFASSDEGPHARNVRSVVARNHAFYSGMVDVQLLAFRMKASDCPGEESFRPSFSI
jgi:hypothetical protein